MLETIVTLYIAFLIVITIHEIGHLPKHIKFFWHFKILPTAAAMQAKSRIGGLLANVAMFSLIFILQPENQLLQFIGLLAWVHFILYSIIGSVVPEANPANVNIKTYVFDDVPNEHAAYYITAAIIALFWMQSYYIPILKGVIM